MSSAKWVAPLKVQRLKTGKWEVRGKVRPENGKVSSSRSVSGYITEAAALADVKRYEVDALTARGAKDFVPNVSGLVSSSSAGKPPSEKRSRSSSELDRYEYVPINAAQKQALKKQRFEAALDGEKGPTRVEYLGGLKEKLHELQVKRARRLIMRKLSIRQIQRGRTPGQVKSLENSKSHLRSRIKGIAERREKYAKVRAKLFQAMVKGTTTQYIIPIDELDYEVSIETLVSPKDVNRAYLQCLVMHEHLAVLRKHLEDVSGQLVDLLDKVMEIDSRTWKAKLKTCADTLATMKAKDKEEVTAGGFRSMGERIAKQTVDNLQAHSCSEDTHVDIQPSTVQTWWSELQTNKFEGFAQSRRGHWERDQYILDDDDLARELKLLVRNGNQVTMNKCCLAINDYLEDKYKTLDELAHLLKTYQLKGPSVSTATTHRWMRLIGAKYSTVEKSYYTDRHETAENVTYRNGAYSRALDVASIRQPLWVRVPRDKATEEALEHRTSVLPLHASEDEQVRVHVDFLDNETHLAYRGKMLAESNKPGLDLMDLRDTGECAHGHAADKCKCHLPLIHVGQDESIYKQGQLTKKVRATSCDAPHDAAYLSYTQFSNTVILIIGCGACSWCDTTGMECAGRDAPALEIGRQGRDAQRLHGRAHWVRASNQC
jgi:hypothetical protein